MDPIINTQLLTLRNILVIGAIAVMWHIALIPVFMSIGTKPNNS